MPRPGQFKTTVDDRLSEKIALALLMNEFPPEMVDRAIAECGRTEQRIRLLPARTVVYFVLAICLFAHRSYAQVARSLAETSDWMAGPHRAPSRVPTTAAVARARMRLGPEPLALLFARSSEGGDRCARYQRRRVLTADAITVAVPDTPQNRARYGPPADGTAQPTARLVALAECGSRTIVTAAPGPRTPDPGHPLTRGLIAPLTRGDLLLTDHTLTGPGTLPALRAAGADVLWRAGPRTALPVHVVLPDGSGLGTLEGRPPAEVRVIDDPPHRLITTLLDHELHPPSRLRALYRRRWELGASFAAVGTLRAERDTPPVLRSRWPGGVEQELWGHLLVHHGIRSLQA
ncbi:IS4 family transposase ISFsp5 [Streptomyces sp. RB5]|uniref:IS4 family transposase ISFsp5 n=1 Tax=Streptomyces smaragdinus TaxID=2585196 RepID=A0A7K0CH55_9ACTN|nr:transposase domain-containing protein [Streptomyces smaragdinus]MQY12342.1 IS4 family transposase ISFsp5 [Streptomyces smaragdinus]